MAGDNLDPAASILLCTENSSACFDGPNQFGASPSWHCENYQPSIRGSFYRSEPLVSSSGHPMPSEEVIEELVEREVEHLPRDDYLRRLRSGDLDLGARREALDWIWKVCAHFRFGPMCFYLSMNYLDRFLSVYQLPTGKAWAVQLLAVACLSVAAKMEETIVPQSVDLQVEPKYVFEAKTIQRMELLVLTTLKWKMQVVTPCSFIDYFLSLLSGVQCPSKSVISRSVQLILSTIKGIDFLEFRPSEIAAAVAISISGELQPEDVDGAISCFIHVKKSKVLKCLELMRDLALFSGSSANASSVPQSPIGVLEAACFSHKSDDITVGSCANSSHIGPLTKRRKQDKGGFKS